MSPALYKKLQGKVKT